MSPLRRHGALAVQAAMTIVLVTLLARRIEWAALRAVFERTPLSMYAAAFVVTAGGQLLYAGRWQVVMRAVNVRMPFGRVFEQYLIGIFFNNFLPSTVGGDWAKIYYAGRREGYLAVAASVVVDRYIGAVSMAVLAALLAWSITGAQAPWPIARGVLTAMAGALIGSVVVMMAIPPGRLAGRFSSSGGIVGRAARTVSGLADHFRTALEHPLAIVMALATPVPYFLMTALFYRVFLGTVSGGPIGFVAVLAAVAAVAALSMIPVTVNGLGLREQLHVALLGAVGVPREAALAVSLVFFSQLLILSLIGWWLWLRHRALPTPQASPAPVDGARR